MIILGVDPGTANIGLGALKDGCHLMHKYISTDKERSLYDRIFLLKMAFRDVLYEIKPDVLVIEEYFSMGSNKDGIHTIKVIGMLIAEAKVFGVKTIAMYSPMTVKTIAIKRPKKDGTKGYEKVTKLDVQNGVNKLLGTSFNYSAAKCHPLDALALCLCYYLKKKDLCY